MDYSARAEGLGKRTGRDQLNIFRYARRGESSGYFHNAQRLSSRVVNSVLLGIALGGFWSMATAVAMRLVPTALLPRALSIIFSGIAGGTVVAVPLGSYLGGLYGWRSAFVAAYHTDLPVVHAAAHGPTQRGAAQDGARRTAAPGHRHRHVGLHSGPYRPFRTVHLHPPLPGKQHGHGYSITGVFIAGSVLMLFAALLIVVTGAHPTASSRGWDWSSVDI